MNDVDRLLTEDDMLVPSAGFTSRVMDAVAEAAVEPPPMPFPWARFGLLALACAVWAASGLWLATTPAVSEIRAAFGSVDATMQRTQEYGVYAAVAFATGFFIARWRRERAPTL